jgi:hypothetical protein
LLFVDRSWKDKIEYGAGQGCKIRIFGEYLGAEDMSYKMLPYQEEVRAKSWWQFWK